MGFAEDFAKTPPGPQREQLVYRAAIEQGPPTQFDPITVPGPGGSQITYYVTHDFLKADNQYLVMTATTAQQIADHFGMYLPSNKIADQVRKAAIAAGTSVTVNPLSGTGYRGADGQWYSPQAVVANRIGATDAAVEYSKRVNEALSKSSGQGGPVHIESGGKYIVLKPADNSLGLYGIWQNGKPIQGGFGTMHPNYEDHVEYGTYVRLVGPKVDIVRADGTRQNGVPMSEFIKSDLHSALFTDGQDIQNGQLASYDVSRDKAQLAQIDKQMGGGTRPSTQAPQMDDIEKFIDQTMSQVAHRMSLYNRIIKQAQSEEESVIDPSRIISPDDYGYQPGVPPPGYKAASFKGRAPKPVEDAAKQVLNLFCPGGRQCVTPKYPHGTMIPFTVDGVNYMARAEVHSNSSYGISVYESTGTSTSPTGGPQARMKLLQRVQDTPSAPDESLMDLSEIFSEIEKDV